MKDKSQLYLQNLLPLFKNEEAYQAVQNAEKLRNLSIQRYKHRAFQNIIMMLSEIFHEDKHTILKFLAWKEEPIKRKIKTPVTFASKNPNKVEVIAGDPDCPLCPETVVPVKVAVKGKEPMYIQGNIIELQDSANLNTDKAGVIIRVGKNQNLDTANKTSIIFEESDSAPEGMIVSKKSESIGKEEKPLPLKLRLDKEFDTVDTTLASKDADRDIIGSAKSWIDVMTYAMSDFDMLKEFAESNSIDAIEDKDPATYAKNIYAGIDKARRKEEFKSK